MRETFVQQWTVQAIDDDYDDNDETATFRDANFNKTKGTIA